MINLVKKTIMKKNKTRTGDGSTGNYSTGNCSTGHGSTGNCSTGDGSTGNRSTGHGSTGNYSTGYYSTGNYSTGDGSTGDCSTGHGSTGNCSTGHGSTGNRSTGHGSTGNYSTGYYSTGNYSTGDGSTGDYSTGYCSTGYCSTGHWSVSKYSSGHFSTEDYSGFGSFNKPCAIDEWSNATMPSFIYFNLTLWIEASKMTDQEKADNKTFNTTKGYLKVLDYKEAWLNAWNGATEEDKELLYALPNFDAEVFKEISGIDVNESSNEMTMAELEKLTGIKNLKIKK